MKTIFTALAPNVEADDARLALGLLAKPWRWKRGPHIQRLYEALKAKLGVPYAFVFESGRTALYALLKCLDLQAGDEVLLQAFTCVAVPNSVMWSGAKPIYVDCEDAMFTMSVEDLKKKITPRSKVIIVQHTFGNTADMEEIMAIAREHKLFVIEDHAHALGLVPVTGDAAFFSFGRDKIISSTFGGAAVTRDAHMGERLRAIKLGMSYPTSTWILQQLWYPLVMHIVRRTYDSGLGKVLLAIVRKLRWISKPVYPEEKRGKKPQWLPRRFPEALAHLALHQLGKLDRYNAHRQKIADIYKATFPSGSGILRFAFCTLNSENMRIAARRSRMFLGDWYTTAIAPVGVSYTAIDYEPASCPVAEGVANKVINFPTDIHITEHDAQRIISTIKQLGSL